jgi:hypothetical protein
VQKVFSLARLSGLLAELCGKQRLALFLAALFHDIEHPGVTAGYLVSAQSCMAAWYKNDPGLLEKHHSIRAFELLICKDIPLLQHLPADDRVNLRSLVRDIILATDMTRHTTILEQAEMLLWGGSGAKAIRNGKDEAASSSPRPPRRLLHMQLLLKCADISNVAQPLPAALEWAMAVTDEFFIQGDMERARGMEVAPPSRPAPYPFASPSAARPCVPAAGPARLHL